MANCYLIIRRKDATASTKTTRCRRSRQHLAPPVDTRPGCDDSTALTHRRRLVGKAHMQLAESETQRIGNTMTTATQENRDARKLQASTTSCSRATYYRTRLVMSVCPFRCNPIRPILSRQLPSSAHMLRTPTTRFDPTTKEKTTTSTA